MTLLNSLSNVTFNVAINTKSSTQAGIVWPFLCTPYNDGIERTKNSKSLCVDEKIFLPPKLFLSLEEKHNFKFVVVTFYVIWLLHPFNSTPFLQRFMRSSIIPL